MVAERRPDRVRRCFIRTAGHSVRLRFGILLIAASLLQGCVTIDDLLGPSSSSEPVESSKVDQGAFWEAPVESADTSPNEQDVTAANTQVQASAASTETDADCPPHAHWGCFAAYMLKLPIVLVKSIAEIQNAPAEEADPWDATHANDPQVRPAESPGDVIPTTPPAPRRLEGGQVY